MAENNGEALQLTKEKIDQALKTKRMPNTERLQLEVLQLIVFYLMNDHPRVMVMWRTYKPAVAAAGIVAATLLTLLASGKLTIMFR
jgi:hypothetical protein